MAHLPQDELPSEFDVVVDGTGIHYSSRVCSNVCVSVYRVGSEYTGSCPVEGKEISASSRPVREIDSLVD